MGKRFWLLLAVMICLLSGCAVPTVDQLYCLPKRPDSYNDLQSVFDDAMSGLEYSAPRNGVNLQTVQMVDLDGDGVREYLLFARGDGDKALRILIFIQEGDKYVLSDTLECSGANFDQVEYRQMDGQGGLELIVGCRISEQVYRSVSVYAFQQGKTQLLMTTSYVKFIPCNLENDAMTELLVLKPGITDSDFGAASVYHLENGVVTRSNEAQLSCPVDKLTRIESGALRDEKPGVFISGVPETDYVRMDVLTMVDGQLVNAAAQAVTDNRAGALEEHYIYPGDIDGDGEMELPELRMVRSPDGIQERHYIRWYTLSDSGEETEKSFTYHHHTGGWYLNLNSDWVPALRISREGSTVSFYQENPETGQCEKIFSVYTLTGQDREEKALADNRFVLYRDEFTVYAARLEVASGALAITRDDIVQSFRLIHQAWKSGEM